MPFQKKIATGSSDSNAARFTCYRRTALADHLHNEVSYAGSSEISDSDSEDCFIRKKSKRKRCATFFNRLDPGRESRKSSRKLTSEPQFGLCTTSHVPPTSAHRTMQSSIFRKKFDAIFNDSDSDSSIECVYDRKEEMRSVKEQSRVLSHYKYHRKHRSTVPFKKARSPVEKLTVLDKSSAQPVEKSSNSIEKLPISDGESTVPVGVVQDSKETSPTSEEDIQIIPNIVECGATESNTLLKEYESLIANTLILDDNSATLLEKLPIPDQRSTAQKEQSKIKVEKLLVPVEKFSRQLEKANCQQNTTSPMFNGTIRRITLVNRSDITVEFSTSVRDVSIPIEILSNMDCERNISVPATYEIEGQFTEKNNTAVEKSPIAIEKPTVQDEIPTIHKKKSTIVEKILIPVENSAIPVVELRSKDSQQSIPAPIASVTNIRILREKKLSRPMFYDTDSDSESERTIMNPTCKPHNRKIAKVTFLLSNICGNKKKEQETSRITVPKRSSSKTAKLKRDGGQQSATASTTNITNTRPLRERKLTRATFYDTSDSEPENNEEDPLYKPNNTRRVEKDKVSLHRANKRRKLHPIPNIL